MHVARTSVPVPTPATTWPYVVPVLTNTNNPTAEDMARFPLSAHRPTSADPTHRGTGSGSIEFRLLIYNLRASITTAALLPAISPAAPVELGCAAPVDQRDAAQPRRPPSWRASAAVPETTCAL
jgi:hypothetical protein